MRSDNVKKGAERAPNRSLFYALGYTPEELDRPLIGVVSAYSEIVPGHMNLDKIAGAVKAGVEMAGGTPILMPAIGVCDGIAMGHAGMKYSLPSRELICDSVETMCQAHQLDGLVLVPNCDKIVPGMVMAACRLDVPAVVCSGGPMLAGSYGGEEVSLSKMFEAVGAYKAGMIDDAQLEDCTCNCCPGCGSCSGMYTANSMNCLCEAVGIALPGNGTIPAVYSKRLQLAKHSGMAIMELVKKNITARQIINERSLRNALTCDMALGCSTNTVLHLLAIAHEAGVQIDLALFNEISARTPNLCHLAPAGPTHMPDLYAAGGIPAVQAELAKKGLLDLDVPTVTGRTLGENIAGARILNENAIRPIDRPYSETGGLQILWGNIAPDGCVVKRSAVAPEMQRHLCRQDRARRRGGHPVRGPQGRPRYAGDAQPHLGPGRHEAGHHRRPHHRRAVLGREPRRVHRARQPRGRLGRAHRPGRGGRHHLDRHPERQDHPGSLGRRAGRPPRPLHCPGAQRPLRLARPLRPDGHQRQLRRGAQVSARKL